jgi:hypothetical protein
MNPSPGFRKFLIVLASIVCVVYLAYRAFFTFNLATPYAVFASVFLYVGELFGIFNLLLYSSRAGRSTSSSRPITRTPNSSAPRSRPACGWTTRTAPFCATTAAPRPG